MNKMHILILYGLPCSGKSGLVNELANYHSVAVDTLIKRRIDDPSLSDFKNMSKDLMADIINELSADNNVDMIIEMGCLIPKESIDYLELHLKKYKFHYLNVILFANDNELIRRIVKRNSDIDAGLLDAIKVDGPDYLSRFSNVFNVNKPDNSVTIDTTSKTSKQIIKEINSLF